MNNGRSGSRIPRRAFGTLVVLTLGAGCIGGRSWSLGPVTYGANGVFERISEEGTSRIRVDLSEKGISLVDGVVLLDPDGQQEDMYPFQTGESWGWLEPPTLVTGRLLQFGKYQVLAVDGGHPDGQSYYGGEIVGKATVEIVEESGSGA